MHILNASCFPVKGYSRSIIYNFGIQEYFFIPNSLYTLLISHSNTQEWLINKTDNEKEIINEYIEFLDSNSCLLNASTIDGNRFSSISLKKEFSEDIAIINLQIDKKCSQKLLQNLNSFLISIRSKNISIEGNLQCSDLFKLLDSIQSTYVYNVELYLPFEEYEKESFEQWITKYPFISSIVLLNAENKSVKYLGSGKNIPIHNVTLNAVNHKNKPISFILSKYFFIESQSYNPFYNRRLFINGKGEIRMHNKQQPIGSIGNIHVANFTQINTHNMFWNIGKNTIEVCKDCEYRHMCYDSRIPKFDKVWFYDTDCGYNPYITKWLDEEGYLPVEDCGTYTKETGFVPDNEKIEKLNEAIWGEE